MITTTNQRTVSGCTVYTDDTDALQVYAVPESPTIAVDAQGKKVFSLLEYRRNIQQVPEAQRATSLGGGLLTFSVDLARTPDQDAAIRTALSTDPALQALLAQPSSDRVDYSDWWTNQIGRDPARLAAAIKINALPVDDGNVAVSVDGEDATHPGDFVTNLVGAGKVSMTGDEQAAFVAKLTMDGAALMWDAVQTNLATIWVGYQLSFTSRLDGVKVIVYCDTWSFYNALQTQWQDLSESGSYTDTSDGGDSTHTYDHSQSASAGNVLQKLAMETQTGFVKVIPSAGPDVIKPDEIAQLTTQGWNMITQFLASTLLQSTNTSDFTTKDDPTLQTQLADGGGGRKYGGDAVSSYSVRQVSETTVGVFSQTLDELATVTSTVNPTGNLSDLLGGQDIKGYCQQIDLDPQFFHYADVQISCTTNFDSEPVDAVKVHMEYHGTAPTGPIDVVNDYAFTKASPAPQTFSTYIAAPDQDSYTYSVEVFYTGSSKTYQFSGKSDETELVLDTDTVGLLAVDLQIGIVDWSRYKSAQAVMSYGVGAQSVSQTFTFTPAKQSDSWVEVLGVNMSGDYTCNITWVDTNDQQITTDPVTAHDRRLVIDQPLQQAMTITIVPAGQFGSDGLLQRIVTALRYEDTANHYEQSTTVSFTSATDMQSWAVPLENPALRNYQYQVSVFYSDGVTRVDDEWQDSDQPILAVGDPFGYKVQFVPIRLGIPPGRWILGKLHVEFSDPTGNVSDTQDFEISDFTQTIDWRFRLADKDRHSYTYQLTLYSADNSPPVVLPTATDTSEVVVLDASQAPAPAPV